MVGEPVTPAKDLAAMHAPAPDPREGLGYVAVRGGGGLGTGSQGIARMAFASFEVWPFAYFGVGIDGSSSETTNVVMFEPDSTDSIQALRGKLALRIPFARSNPSKTPFFMTAFGLGPGRLTTTREYEPETSAEPFCILCRGTRAYETRESTSTELAVLLEAGIFVRMSAFQLGGALRLDFAHGTTIGTLAASVGLEF